VRRATAIDDLWSGPRCTKGRRESDRPRNEVFRRGADGTPCRV